VNQGASLESGAKLSFRRVSGEERQADLILRPSSTYLRDSLNSLLHNPLGMVGAVIVILMVLIALLGPMLLPYSYEYQNLEKTFQTPNATHWMGTDNLGRDMTIRVVHGARISLLVGFVAASISIVVGVFYGVISGFWGGMADLLMMRLVEIFSSVPSMLYIILLAQVFPSGGLANIVLVMGLTSWMGTARLVRGEVLSLKSREYVLAARVSCVANFRIMTRHLIPNSIGPIIVSLTLGIPGAIFTEASLRFLGVMNSVVPSWGSLASDGIKSMRAFPHLIIFPALFISVTILAFNLLSDALQKAFDPMKR